MGQILKFIPPDTNFDPETIAILGAAFDKTIESLHDGRQPDVVREAIAKRIIALASKGERNPDRLCEMALSVMGASALMSDGDKRSEQIRYAYAQAKDCARYAQTADLRERHQWLVLERRWHALARSIEFTLRLEALEIDPRQRNRSDGLSPVTVAIVADLSAK